MRLPSATYRLQMGQGVGFAEARALVPYLDALGVSDLYTSPLLQARSGTAHGYDVTDPSRLHHELGGDDDFDALAAELHGRDMGLLVDIVPNHMAAGADNPWWRSVLEHGSASPFARYFDIDWRPSHSPLENQVLLPVLGSHYGQALEAGELTPAFDGDGFVIRYADTEIPVNPVCWAPILEEAAALAAADEAGSAPAAAAGLAALAQEAAALPRRTNPSARVRRRRLERTARIRQRLRRLASDAAVRAAIRTAVDRFRGEPGQPRSFDRLDRLLSDQAYVLAFWRAATEEVNYRRFFDIGDLISVRAEDPAVFDATHGLILRLVGEGKIAGLRVDHVDGLYDPEAYLRRLAERAGGRGGCYLLVEKILAPDEALPSRWPVHGTTGYDFLNAVNGLFVDPEGFERIRRFHGRHVGRLPEFHDLAFNAKRQVIRELFAGDVRGLEWMLIRLARQDRHGRDIPGRELAAAIAAVAACLSVYRTYIRGGAIRDADRRRVEDAVADAARRSPNIDPAALEFVRRVLLLELPETATPRRRRRWIGFVQRWQQFTGPITAKGIEDTALYVYNPLTSLNEVGSEPGRGAVSIAEFHRRIAARAEAWPAAMNTTATHDNKRGEDVRARIHVLSELPGVWQRQLQLWTRLNAPFKETVAGRPVPGPNFEVLLYQAILGVWPLDGEGVDALPDRMQAYALKAAREAKVHTTWIHPDEGYEAALVAFVRRILEPGSENRFLPALTAFVDRIAAYGAQNSLSQLVIKLAAPGVPDIYQGAELWCLDLVDPDNRRAVAFERRARALAELDAAAGSDPDGLARSLLESWRDGRIKLHVTARCLRFRRSHADLFSTGEYLPLEVRGRWREHVLAFARRRGEHWAMAVAPIRVAAIVPPGAFAMGDVWRRTELGLPDAAPVEWREVIADQSVSAQRADGRIALPLDLVFRHLPVALLHASPPDAA